MDNGPQQNPVEATDTHDNLASASTQPAEQMGLNSQGVGAPSGTGGGLLKRRLLALVGALVAVVLLGAAVGYALLSSKDGKANTGQQTAAQKVKIGVLFAFSGGSSSMGYGAIKGVELAQKQLNASNIELIQADGKCDATEAPKAMDYLIGQKVVAIIGENCSSASVAMLEKANQHKILLLSPSASSPKLSIENDYFFRTVPSDVGQGTFLAQSLRKKGIKNAAVFFTTEPYGTAIKDVFVQQFEKLGGKVVATVSAESSVIDVQKQVEQIKAAKPDVVAIVANSTVSSTAVMKKARELGITAPFYGGDTMYDNTIIANSGAASEGLHVVSFPAGSKTFKQALVNEYHLTEQLYAAAEAYDAFDALYRAALAGAKTGEDFKRTLPTITFGGQSGQISFDKYGEVPYQNYAYDLFQVKDGAFALAEQ